MDVKHTVYTILEVFKPSVMAYKGVVRVSAGTPKHW